MHSSELSEHPFHLQRAASLDFTADLLRKSNPNDMPIFIPGYGEVEPRYQDDVKNALLWLQREAVAERRAAQDIEDYINAVREKDTQLYMWHRHILRMEWPQIAKLLLKDIRKADAIRKRCERYKPE